MKTSDEYLEPGQPYCVTWLDACFHVNENPPEDRGAICVTLGWFIGRDQYGTPRFSMEINEDRDIDEARFFMDIPEEMILQTIQLSI